MIRPILLLLMAAILNGCASMTDPLPKCDGYSRRPLNRTMWQWEEYRRHEEEYSDVRQAMSSPMAPAAYAEEPEELPALAHLDVDGSYRPCEE